MEIRVLRYFLTVAKKDLLVQRKLSPEITSSIIIAWRRNIPYSLAVRKFMEEIQENE